jgi:hypothetical protein
LVAGERSYLYGDDAAFQRWIKITHRSFVKVDNATRFNGAQCR